MNTFENIHSRRSTRKLKDIMISDDQLSKLIEAGRCAPCGSNSQQVHFIVIQNREVLSHLACLCSEEFSKMEISEDTYVSLKNSILASRKGNYAFHYNAPLLILTAAPRSYGNNTADCACALENMMLAANEMDLGSCWINQVHWLTECESVRRYLYQLGMKEGEVVCGGLIAGYPDTPDGMPIRTPRNTTGNPVTYVR